MVDLKGKKGFTLIEIVVVMTIIAVLAALVVGAIMISKRMATETANRQNARTLRTCLEAYSAKYKKFCGGGMDPGGFLLLCNQTYSFKGAVYALSDPNNQIQCSLGSGATNITDNSGDPLFWTWPNGGGSVIATEQSYIIKTSNAAGDAQPGGVIDTATYP